MKTTLKTKIQSLKITFAGILFLIIGIVTAAEINYEEAIRSARTAETDGEIQAILQGHGFQMGIYDEITMKDKIEALYHLSSN